MSISMEAETSEVELDEIKADFDDDFDTVNDAEQNASTALCTVYTCPVPGSECYPF